MLDSGKKNNYLLTNAIIFVLVAVAVITVCVLCYKYSSGFKSMFGGAVENIGKVPESGETIARRNERAGWVSLGLFTGIVVVQVFCLFAAITVFRQIKEIQEDVEAKLARIANADIFLDLPLYVGLFGSVSSFMVMSISSSGGQLIAYSSTLIGIIFCTCMRLFLMYPLKSKLIELGHQK